MTGIELIAKERQEQIEKHGISLEMDKGNAYEELVQCARYCLSPTLGSSYPRRWSQEFKQKLDCKTQKERLIIAGALIAAEIDRLQAMED